MIDFSKFTTTEAETQTITGIANRALAFNAAEHLKQLDIVMYIETAHNSCPLRLEELLAAKDADFLHDVFGIIRNLSQETGLLKNHFWPRYAKDTISASPPITERGA